VNESNECVRTALFFTHSSCRGSSLATTFATTLTNGPPALPPPPTPLSSSSCRMTGSWQGDLAEIQCCDGDIQCRATRAMCLCTIDRRGLSDHCRRPRPLYPQLSINYRARPRLTWPTAREVQGNVQVLVRSADFMLTQCADWARPRNAATKAHFLARGGALASIWDIVLGHACFAPATVASFPPFYPCFDRTLVLYSILGSLWPWWLVW
jgi:hypothetical protein